MTRALSTWQPFPPSALPKGLTHRPLCETPVIAREQRRTSKSEPPPAAEGKEDPFRSAPRCSRYLQPTLHPHGLRVEMQVLVENRVHGLFQVQLSALAVLQREEAEGGLLKDLPAKEGASAAQRPGFPCSEFSALPFKGVLARPVLVRVIPTNKNEGNLKLKLTFQKTILIS